MIRCFLLLLIAISILSCNSNSTNVQKGSKGDTTLKILTYGLGDMERTRAENTVARKYGFTFYGVAGCVVSEKLVDSVKKENKRVDKIIEQRFGKDWKNKFYKQVDAMLELQSKVEALVRKEPYIINKENELFKQGNGLDLSIDPVYGQNIFAVKASGWGKWKGEDALVIYYELTVDLKKNSVTKDSDTLKLMEYALTDQQ